VKTADSLSCEGDSPTPVRCRICWGFEENKELDPLILACKCKGSVGFIHFQCLKQWINSQKNEKEISEHVTTIFWKKFECEICKQSYPYIFKSEDQRLFKLTDIHAKD